MSIATASKTVVGIDDAGPMGAMGLGWVIVFPEGNRPLILEKTGGLQGFFVYVVIAPTRGVGAFFVMNEFNARRYEAAVASDQRVRGLDGAEATSETACNGRLRQRNKVEGPARPLTPAQFHFSNRNGGIPGPPGRPELDARSEWRPIDRGCRRANTARLDLLEVQQHDATHGSRGSTCPLAGRRSALRRDQRACRRAGQPAR